MNDNNSNEKSRLMHWAKITLIVLVVFLAAQALITLKGLGVTNPAYNSITVTGEGEAVSIPDVAEFWYSVSHTSKTVAESQGRVTERMDVILNSLQEAGIEERDIKTTDYSVAPKYVYSSTICSPTYCPPATQTLEGYTTSHMVTVKVRNTEEVGKILALVGDEGATNVSNVTFTIDDPDALLEEARAEAILNAREKAKTLARDLGVRLVRVVSFYENTGPRPYGGDHVLGEEFVKLSSAPTLPVGENKTTVTVNVTYEIR